MPQIFDWVVAGATLLGAVQPVIELSDGEVLGRCGLRTELWFGTAEIEYWISPVETAFPWERRTHSLHEPIKPWECTELNSVTQSKTQGLVQGRIGRATQPKARHASSSSTLAVGMTCLVTRTSWATPDAARLGAMRPGDVISRLDRALG
ncbi:MAG: hypothetical protein ACI8V4_003514 [Ilumatobacter sp.]|jgi:hypothetical protein